MGRFLDKFLKKEQPEDRALPTGAPDSNILIATCALLLEMAQADGEFSETEKKNLLKILQQDYGLSGELAGELTETAQKELAESIDLWQFTNEINEHYSREEKLKVIEQIWKIVYADGTLEMHEDYLVHKLAKLLNIKHDLLIDAKLNVLHGGE